MEFKIDDNTREIIHFAIMVGFAGYLIFSNKLDITTLGLIANSILYHAGYAISGGMNNASCQRTDGKNSGQ
jgi:hypothetical protein